MLARIVLLLGVLLATPAMAADNATLLTPCASGCVTMRSKDVGAGVQSMIQILGDTSGNAIYGTAGTANANVLSVQGIASGTALPVSAASLPLPTGAATAALQGTNTATTAHTCSVAGYSELGCLGQIDDDVKSTGTIKGAGTAGTADTGVVTIQGIASMTKLLVTPDSVALPANQSVNTSQVNGVTVLTGTGATGTGAQRVTVSTDQATNAGAALVKGGVGVVNGGSFYQAVAASQTATVLQSSTGATGDYLSHCVLYPTSTSPGVVTVFDNTNAAGTSAILFPGGATSLSNLAPISIPVGAISTAGAWKVTTGSAISAVCYGKFS